MQMNIKEIAVSCKSIITEPEKNIKKIKTILNIKTENEKEKAVIYISLLKVFKSIIPLYKIRTLKDKVKYKKDDLEITEGDKTILKMYSLFINTLCSDTSFITYIIASEIMAHFEHFNFIDIIIKKILKGTIIKTDITKTDNNSNVKAEYNITDNNINKTDIITDNNNTRTDNINKTDIITDIITDNNNTRTDNISNVCLNTLKNIINEDKNGDLIFCIVNQMYETQFHPEVLSFLLEINLLKDFLEEETEKPKDKFFKIKRSFKKQERKLEKKRRQIEEERRKEKNQEEKQDGFVIHRKIVDSLQRLYFLILRDKIKQKYKYTFIGLKKYKKFIRKEFYEGLYVLLNDSLNISNYEEKLYCILTVLDIYESYRYDFKKLVQALYEILFVFNTNLDITKMKLIEEVVDKLFIKIKQPVKRVHLILERFLIFGCLRYNPVIKRIISKLQSFYDIDFTETFRFNEENALEEDLKGRDIDQIEIKPLYCYEIFKNIL
ncbi:nucleolar complex-associated protein 3 (NOC3) [Vairimorpha necatrix]|uniref:Nucleolar complex-associated protein 3 (NOC3) n=1 Tax=Vairimorpha necatrix TaxID=6039 RepID=A0AAX4JA16_9MICR